MKSEAFLDAIEQFKFEIWFMLFLSGIAVLLPLSFKIEDAVAARAKQTARAQRRQVQASAVESPETAAVIETASVNHAPPTAPVTQTTLWPIQGRVTADYGITHRPWQRMHSGIDISSGRRSGITGVRTFKEGTVLKTIRSNYGYGSHIIIDHGEGITSYYAHLSSIHVQAGQRVKPGDVIGREGGSGTVTGSHLHFEIRLHNTPVNPRLYISGNPN